MSATASWPIRCATRSRRIATGLSAMTWDRTRRPVSGSGSIVTRKSASANSEVSWQITTEAWLSGIAFDCTMTAGRGFPESPGAATITKSPRRIDIEFGYHFDPQKRLAFAVGAQLGNLRRDPLAHGLGARIGDDEAQFAQAL